MGSQDTAKNESAKLEIFKILFHKLLIILLIPFANSLPVFSQEYIRIEGIKKVLRAFSEATDETVNDSTTITVQKIKNKYKIRMLVKGKESANCFYVQNGQVHSQSIRTRVLSKKGSKIVLKKIRIKIIIPLKENCKIYFLYNENALN